MLSRYNLSSQLKDPLFPKLVTERAVQQFEIWQRSHQLLDCRQRYIPGNGLDSKKIYRWHLNVICLTIYVMIDFPSMSPVSQYVKLLKGGQGGKSSKLSVTSLEKKNKILHEAEGPMGLSSAAPVCEL